MILSSSLTDIYFASQIQRKYEYAYVYIYIYVLFYK